MSWSDFDVECMQQALELALRGEGSVEPNPMVGCVIAREGQILSRGWHGRFGGPHAEIVALQEAGDANVAGATAYVTLEPCCHVGKTPPCTEALLAAGIGRVVVAMRDPFPKVAGEGVKRLSEAGVMVELGCLEEEARKLNAPYLKLLIKQRPWMIAKWAMTLDGKIASRSNHSQWISGAASRAIVHRLRGRVDAILIGSGTAEIDDPLLTARPAGARVATRIVVDSHASLPLKSRLVRTAREWPVLIAVGPEAESRKMSRLVAAGCEVLPFAPSTHYERLLQLLEELGRRRMTNVLVEGGAGLLGSLFDAQAIDEVHTFIAPKLLGGERALSPLGGLGLERVPELPQLQERVVEMCGDDIYVRGRLIE